MTREEAIMRLKVLTDYEYDEDLEALEMAIKALEQEPFMNKPCVAHQICREDKVKVLGKIRAEIEEVIWEDVVVSSDGTDEIRIPRLDPDEVLNIIDKYKVESRSKE